MKTKILKFSVFLLLFALICASCQDDDDLFEIQIGDENAVIQKTIDGIEFKFCLLNEQGEPATVFNEGENFTFQFSIKNFGENPLPFYDYGYLSQSDFFQVQSTERSYGQPFRFKTYTYSKEMRWLFDEQYLNKNNLPSYEFSAPWKDIREKWQLSWSIFEGMNQELLGKGKYYTKFSYQFKFGYPNEEPELITKNLNFKINFEVK